MATEHPDIDRYDPARIEAKWQAVWAAEESFRVENPEPGNPGTGVASGDRAC
jgi:valyl-tRNA synthetase